MTSPSSGSGPAAPPPAAGGRPLLRAARHGRGWSQAAAARELSDLAARTGVTVAGAASLKTQLSRWENGHAAPEPEYRALLGALYDRDPAGLGLVAGGHAPADVAGPAGQLPGAIAEAEALDETALGLLRDQVEATARLDHRLGPAGAADVLAAQVERLIALADHVLPGTTRRAVCTVLAEAALLAGDLERDRARASVSWARYGTARAAAHEAGRSDLAARAWAARAGLLVDAGEPGRARTLLGDATDEWSALVRAEAGTVTAPDDAVPATTAPAGGTTPDAPGSRSPDRRAPDAVWPGISVEVEALRHRRNLARAEAGDDRARAALERAVTDEERPVRERAEASATLALVLRRSGHPTDAAVHARRAHLLALRIGAPRIAALAAAADPAGPDPTGPDPTGPDDRAQRSVAPARSSSAAE